MASPHLMRWLLIKDLQILRRSPLVTALLVDLPGRDRGAGRLRALARARQAAGRLPQRGPAGLSRGDRQDDSRRGAGRTQLCSRIECVDVSSEAEARQKVKSGDVLAALILPAGPRRQAPVRALDLGLPAADGEGDRQRGGPGQGAAGRRPDHDSLLNEANLRVSGQFSDTLVQYLDLLLNGGDFSFLGQSLNILGLKETQQIITRRRPLAPQERPQSRAARSIR